MVIHSIPESTRLVLGGRRVLTELTSELSHAPGLVTGEVYQATYQPIIAALAQHAQAGKPLQLLVNAHLLEHASTPEIAVARTLVDGHVPGVAIFGGELDQAGAPWVHSKTFFLDGEDPHAWITNLALRPDSVDSSELALVVRGDAAQAVRELTVSARGTDTVAKLKAQSNAAWHGVLVNDPTTGMRAATEAIAGLLDEKTSAPLLVLTKTIDDMPTTRAIIKAHQSGRAVEVYARELGAADAKALSAAGVPTWVAPNSHPKIRVNAIVGGDGAYVGSNFLWGPLLRPTQGAEATRDIGVYARGTVADKVHAAVRQVIATTDGWEPLAPAAGAAHGFVESPEMLVGGKAGMQALEGVALAAHGRLSGDLFRLTDTVMASAIQDAWRGGAGGAALVTAHPGAVAQVAPLAEGTAAHVRTYGGLAASEHPAVFIHSKSLVADRSLGAVTTVAIRRQARRNTVEVTGLFRGASAGVLDDLLTAAARNDPQAMRTAAQSAAVRGVLVNDPVAGVHPLSDALKGLLRAENKRLVVVTKSLRDPEAVQLIVDARGRGASVTVYAGSMSVDAETRLRSAGVELLGKEDDPVHANVIIGQGQGEAIWSSAHMTPRAFGAGTTDGLNGSSVPISGTDVQQTSRELGAITNDPTAIQTLLDGIASFSWTPWRQHPLPHMAAVYD